MGNNKSILDMTHKEARVFLLKSKSYFSAEIPDYINLEPLVKSAKEYLTSKKGGVKKLSDIITFEPNPTSNKNTIKYKLGEYSDLNYTIVINKDGAYSWRPLTLVHPILYVDLVNTITTVENWSLIKERFVHFNNLCVVNNLLKIVCYSLPLESTNKRTTDTAESVLNWWENIEQGSLKESIDFHYCLHTDIADFYPSIYTHSIPWALHGKEAAKEKQWKKNLFGDVIDTKIRNLQHGQTNGIPQGSVLMDFIAEIILRYVDSELTVKLTINQIIDYKILRYRDDYRIFSNDKDELERIARILTEVLFETGLKLNAKKTFLTDDIVKDSIKSDKWYWESIRSKIRHKVQVGDSRVTSYSLTPQKHLWEIYTLSKKYPNSGMLKKALTEFNNERIKTMKKSPTDLEPIVGILSSIMVNNPTCLEHCVIAIGQLLKKCNNNKLANSIIESIMNKFESKANTDFAELWLQRLSIMFGEEHTFNSELTRKVNKTTISEATLFNSEWLEIKNGESFSEDIIDEVKLEEMKLGIKSSEVDLFTSYE